MDFSTLQMTLSHRNNTKNGLPKLKSQENDVLLLFMFLASFVEKSYLTLKYLAAILFSHWENSAQGCQSDTMLISDGDIP